jgi:aspartate racemase
MKRIGIVGGVGWQSTVEYYAGLCRLSEKRRVGRKPGNEALTPEICIESLDLNTAAALLGHDDDEQSWRGFDDYHRTALMRLQACDSEIAVIASNTPHHRYASIVRGIGIPVLSILDATAQEANRMGVTRVLILGTALTMQSRMYPDALRRYGIEAGGPSDARNRAAAVKIIAEIHREHIAGADERIDAIARACCGGEVPPDTAVCLACTELPLAFPGSKESPSFERDDIRYINTAAAHIHALFRFACG